MCNVSRARALAACIAVVLAFAAALGACSSSNEDPNPSNPRPGSAPAPAAAADAADAGPTADQSSGSNVGDAGCQPYDSDASLTTPVASFARDVLPIFRQGCGVGGAACHSAAKPVLVPPDGGAGMTTLLAGIVGKRADEDPAMNFVTPGDPAKSYLMHKVDGDQCALAADCSAGQSAYHDCGSSMPYDSPPLPQNEKDTIRRWIAQGAKNE